MKNPFNILLADDESSIREIWGELLKEEGFDIDLAEDGLNAKELIKKKNYDLLITDFRMPNMDGAQLLEWCRDHDFHFPVIFITGNLELLEKEKVALGDCCANLLRKPASLKQMLSAIKDAQLRNHSRMCFD